MSEILPGQVSVLVRIGRLPRMFSFFYLRLRFSRRVARCCQSIGKPLRDTRIAFGSVVVDGVFAIRPREHSRPDGFVAVQEGALRAQRHKRIRAAFDDEDGAAHWGRLRMERQKLEGLFEAAKIATPEHRGHLFLRGAKRRWIGTGRRAVYAAGTDTRIGGRRERGKQAAEAVAPNADRTWSEGQFKSEIDKAAESPGNVCIEVAVILEPALALARTIDEQAGDAMGAKRFGHGTIRRPPAAHAAKHDYRRPGMVLPRSENPSVQRPRAERHFQLAYRGCRVFREP